MRRPPDPVELQLSRLAAVPGHSAAVPGEVNGSLILAHEARLSRSQVRWREPRSVPVKNFIRTDRGSSLMTSLIAADEDGSPR